ncbi:sulfotransferase [Azospirillum sp.]|uniref:sulfotransferase n=1 Tax=Azospirillum sp. TaxID=34012 RepID=UPI002D33A36F|nr:sulfotransferase [Azospirillum sp.]HYD64519.1 sulfotransferase [Azospirillum sp.]
MTFQPVFLISSPRSGSNWTKAALNAHPDIVCTEQRLYGGFFEMWVDDPVTGRSNPRFTLDRIVDIMSGYNNYPAAAGDLPREELARRMTGRLARSLFELAHDTSGKRLVVDKLTPYLDSCATVAEGIRRDFPEARIVYLERDPRDVLTSGVFNWLKRRRQDTEWNPVQRARHERFVLKRDDVRLDRFFTPDDIAYWVGHWTGPVDHILPIADLTLRYETLHGDQAGELKRLFDALGVAGDEAILRGCLEASSFARLSGGRSRGQEDPDNPTAMTRKGIVGDWRHYVTRADGEAIQAHTGERLQARGYEADKGWIKGLPERLAL